MRKLWRILVLRWKIHNCGLQISGMQMDLQLGYGCEEMIQWIVDEYKEWFRLEKELKELRDE
tara:strand:- start:26973 stop:27158 length:186 start_codon:yes stop_codon:yes gene_type:complete